MKSKHVFICEHEVSPAMRVHLVLIGSSAREKQCANRLQRCAARNPDAYFHVFDENVCEFLSKLAMQVYPLMAPRDAREKFNECNIIRHSDSRHLLNSVPCQTESRKKPKVIER